MIRVARLLSALCLVLIVAAPVAAKPKKPPPPSVLQPDPDPASGMALVYIFRPNGLPLWDMPMAIHIDGAHVATLRAKDCVALKIPAGEHVLSQSWTVGSGEAGRRDVWQAGQAYYYEFHTKTSEDMRYRTITWYIVRFSAAARPRLEGCNVVPVLNRDAPAPSPGRP